MQISLISLSKNEAGFRNLNEKYAKFIAHFAKFKEICAFSAKIHAAQKKGRASAQKAYAEALSPYKKGFCVILHERGKELDSVEFSQILAKNAEISFFLGGAFGFEDEFTGEFDLALSLSRLTLAHDLAKIVLLEQLYRGFCILAKHPYHK